MGSSPLRSRSSYRSFIALAMLFAACLVVVIGVIRAPTGSVARRLSEEERKAVGGDLAALEPAWLDHAVNGFPGDSWSQEDDFARAEYDKALSEAGRLGVHVGDVLRAADESLRAQSAGRRVGVSPCKPRPFYD